MNAIDQYNTSLQEAHEWAEQIFGERPAYPGHPILLSVLIMDRYQSLAHARLRDAGAIYSNVASDWFIPGAGDAVCSALDVLELALQAQADATLKAFAEAERYWAAWERQQPGNARSAAAGRELAERAKALFLARLAGWKSGELLPCPYRKVLKLAA
jgi:hypothetical protein